MVFLILTPVLVTMLVFFLFCCCKAFFLITKFIYKAIIFEFRGCLWMLLFCICNLFFFVLLYELNVKLLLYYINKNNTPCVVLYLFLKKLFLSLLFCVEQFLLYDDYVCTSCVNSETFCCFSVDTLAFICFCSGSFSTDGFFFVCFLSYSTVSKKNG